jgi:DNA-binding XRE family transcriptional regulator
MSAKLTAGQRLWQELYRAGAYRTEALKIVVPENQRMTPELATRRWLDGMARNLEHTFSDKFRSARERVGITQLQLAQTAQLSVTGLALIERGERLPGLETAARICWALDVLSYEPAQR